MLKKYPEVSASLVSRIPRLDNIITKEDLLVATKGQEVTAALKELLYKYYQQGTIGEAVLVVRM